MSDCRPPSPAHQWEQKTLGPSLSTTSLPRSWKSPFFCRFYHVFLPALKANDCAWLYGVTNFPRSPEFQHCKSCVLGTPQSQANWGGGSPCSNSLFLSGSLLFSSHPHVRGLELGLSLHTKSMILGKGWRGRGESKKEARLELQFSERALLFLQSVWTGIVTQALVLVACHGLEKWGENQE